jgi:hypothetical protein
MRGNARFVQTRGRPPRLRIREISRPKSIANQKKATQTCLSPRRIYLNGRYRRRRINNTMPPSFGTSGLKPEPTRLRQIALVAEDLAKAREVLVRFRNHPIYYFHWLSLFFFFLPWLFMEFLYSGFDFLESNPCVEIS